MLYYTGWLHTVVQLQGTLLTLDVLRTVTSMKMHAYRDQDKGTTKSQRTAASQRCKP